MVEEEQDRTGKSPLAGAYSPDDPERVDAPPVAHPSFLADRLASRWAGSEPVRPDESVSAAIARFSPDAVPEAQWARLGPIVRKWVEQAAPDTVYSARTLMSIVTQLVLWVDTIGQPLRAEVVLHPDTIDRFVTEGCAHRASGTRLNYRRHLRCVGEAVLGPSLYPPRPLPIQRDGVLAPYSAPEIAALMAWAQGLPTERFRHTAHGVLAFGLGAGLTSQEMSRAVGDDIVADADGVVISVVGSEARTVPVWHDWEDAVAELGRRAGGGPVLMPERTRISRHQLKNFMARCPSGDAPVLDTGRLRASWIVRHLTAGTQLRALVTAAGVQANQLAKYLAHVAPLDPGEARRQLHGGGPQ